MNKIDRSSLQNSENARRLFHPDNEEYFDIKRLRSKAHSVVDRSSLIARCIVGDRDAAIALKMGFHPYVAEFQAAIDKKANSSKLPRRPLYEKFGREAARETLLTTAENVRQLQRSELEAVFTEAERELIKMQHDEWTHWHHWVHDAMAVGLARAELERAHIVPGVQMLIDAAHSDDLVKFFAGSLAATEFMAEELGERLAFNPNYNGLFQEGRPSGQRGKAYWMIVHTVPHVDGPSHADIVLDFARAYDADDGPEHIHLLVERGLELFGVAADEVEAYFSPAIKLSMKRN